MLQRQNIVMPLAEGVDTKTDKKQVVAGRLLELENGVFTTLKTITKRDGLVALSNKIGNRVITNLTTSRPPPYPSPAPPPAPARPAMDPLTTVEYHFDEAGVPIINYGSLGTGINLEGEVQPGVLYGQSGLFGNAVYLDGTPGAGLYHSGAPYSALSGQQFTMLATLTPEAAGIIGGRLFADMFIPSLGPWVIGMYQQPNVGDPTKLNIDVYLRLAYTFPTTLQIFSYTGTGYSYGVPTVVGYTYDEVLNEIKGYINGNLVINATPIPGQLVYGNSQGAIVIGRDHDNPASSMKGTIDDFRIVDRVMSAAEILTFSNTALGI